MELSEQIEFMEESLLLPAKGTAYRQAILASLRKLQSIESAGGMPEEPTEEMIEAGKRMMDSLVGDQPKLIYKAMYRAHAQSLAAKGEGKA